MINIKFLRIFYKTCIFLFSAFLIVIIGCYTYAYLSHPIELNTIGTYQMYDKNDNLVYQGSSENKWVSLDDVSPDFVNAIISVEDKNYYKHNGFDYLRIAKALLKNIKSNTIVEGASTISQQYIKNAYLDFDQTWSRKLKEALMTLNLEVHYSKKQILEAYINTINFGQGNYGINNASKYYFNKSPKELNLEESIILAGIPKSPNNYNPVKSYSKSIKRAKLVSLTMYNNKAINKKEYKKLFKNKIKIYGQKNPDDLDTIMYYQDAVLSELKKINGITDKMINSGKLKVYTTLDFDVQQTLENNIKKYLTHNMQVASIIVNPNDGGVMALTGGRDYAESQYNRALQAKRQVGSTMKPFLYYTALKNGMTASSTFLSQKTTFNLSNGKTYSPKNYGNVYANKDITMAAAIAYSDNIYAVKTNLFLGVEEMINTAKMCGIEENLNAVPSLALGTSEISMIDFARGYTTFASGGYKRNIHFITKITDNEGTLLYEYENDNNLVLNPNYVYILNEMLTSTTSSAFLDYNTPTALSIASKLKQKYALKTGTTDTDHWEVGYNKNALMMIWTGYDNNKNVNVNDSINVKNIWANTIETINPDQNNWYQLPDNVIGIPLNSIDGKQTTNAKKTNIFYFVKGSEP